MYTLACHVAICVIQQREILTLDFFAYVGATFKHVAICVIQNPKVHISSTPFLLTWHPFAH